MWLLIQGTLAGPRYTDGVSARMDEVGNVAEVAEKAARLDEILDGARPDFVVHSAEAKTPEFEGVQSMDDVRQANKDLFAKAQGYWERLSRR